MKVDRLNGREEVLGPPKGWRPRALTVAEKLEIVVRQGGFDFGRFGQPGNRLDPLGCGVQFDHQPAIQERRWDPAAGDTSPPSCSLDHIVALNRDTHAVKTAKRDIPEISKTRRLEKGPKVAKQRFPSRQFPKRRT